MRVRSLLAVLLLAVCAQAAPFTTYHRYAPADGYGTTDSCTCRAGHVWQSSQACPTCSYHIQDAVNAWIADPTQAAQTHGDINTWDVSAVTDMCLLFSNAATFNGDITGQ
jgi:hypothetical protein